MKKKAPIILSKKLVASSSLFHIESIELLFSNGEKRIYERLKPTNRNAVMIVLINQNKEIILIKEYAVGTENYELGFPKGLIDSGESPVESANRELKEEIGYGAKKFVLLKETKLAPSYFSSSMSIFLATNLYKDALIGDEPEPLDKVYWPMADAQKLLSDKNFREARSIAALYLALDRF